MSFINKMPRYEILSEESMATLTLGWKRIVSEIGIEFMSPWAIDLLRENGQTVEGDNVKFDCTQRQFKLITIAVFFKRKSINQAFFYNITSK